MNYIKDLEAKNKELRGVVAGLNSEIDDFIGFLCGPKFTGVESDGERKDWIATGDVINILRNIKRQ